MSEPAGDPAPLHVPVLVAEVLAALAPRPGARVLDGTLGAGGHAAAILARIAPGGLYVGVDRDAEVLEAARARLLSLGAEVDGETAPGAPPDAPARGARVRIVHGTFDALASLALAHAPADPSAGRAAGFDAVLLDVGVSSLQLDRPERGFGFAASGPLDMRMDPSSGEESAADLVRRLSEEDLANLIFEYGEERLSRRIARAICESRRRGRIETTGQLADIVAAAVPARYEGGRIHPSTRTFQALRIAVNDELGQLERALAALPAALAPGGRAAVISFHSLEDRIVKHALKDAAKSGLLHVLTKKPVEAGEDEVRANRRARSAKLRAAMRPTTPPAPSGGAGSRTS
jgi:16S rRNA (cytosine1402-N4)-methyltransferase